MRARAQEEGEAWGNSRGKSYDNGAEARKDHVKKTTKLETEEETGKCSPGSQRRRVAHCSIVRARNIEMIFSSSLSHTCIQSIRKSGWPNLPNLFRVWPLFTLVTSTSLIQTFISSCLRSRQSSLLLPLSPQCSQPSTTIPVGLFNWQADHISPLPNNPSLASSLLKPKTL